MTSRLAGFQKDNAVAMIVIFFDERVSGPDGGVDSEQTKTFHCKKYCAFKFAGFLGLLHSGKIIWRGQAESESMRLAQRGLNYFQRADLQQKGAMLARWIRRPEHSSLCAKQDIRPARGENETRIVAAWIERRRKIGAENSLSQC